MASPVLLGEIAQYSTAGTSAFPAAETSFLASEEAGATAGLLQLLINGINSWNAARERRKQQEEQKRQFNVLLAERQAQFAAQQKMAQNQLGLNRQQFVEQIRQANLQNDHLKDQKNYQRATSYANKIMQMFQLDQGLKNSFANSIGGLSGLGGRYARR